MMYVRCMIYIMRRTQIYLDDDLWTALHARAKSEHTTVSELMRKAAREQYQYTPAQRRADMLAAIGIWKSRTDLPDTETYVRSLRKSTRMKRLGLE
jgi:Arc/MetJ family transcription regulator